MSEAVLLHVPDEPYAYGIGAARLRVIVRAPAGAIRGGAVAYNDRYAWEGNDYAPLRESTPLRLYARDGDLAYWAADLHLRPPRLRYRFGLDTPDGRRWFGWDGLRDEPAPRGAFEFAYLAEGDRPAAPAWARGAVFYHVFPDRFARASQPHRRAPVEDWEAEPARDTFLGGDLDGIVERLDHIASLSVDALYLTPIFSAPSNHKYDTADYFSVDADFGGNAALRRLVDALHRRGMRLILDGVFNHAGATWPPFVDVRQRGRRSRHASWFYFRGDRYETWATDVASLPKLRTSEPEVRELVCRIGRFWIQEYGIDGWRLDVANEVDHALWKAFRRAVREVNREALLVGEIWDWALPWLRGDEFDSAMNYQLRSALLRFAAARPPTELRTALDGEGLLDAIDRLRAAYPEPVHDYLYNLIGSHDEVRPLSALGGDRGALAVAAGLLYALPGIVSVYYGDEVGMTGGKGPLNRGGMIWDAQRQDARLLQAFRTLGRLRRELPVLRGGVYTRLGARERLAVFARGRGRDRLFVLANAGATEQAVAPGELGLPRTGAGQVAATISLGGRRASQRAGRLRLPPQSVTLVAQRRPAR